MMPVLLSFAWLPLFFFFMHRFAKQCAVDVRARLRADAHGAGAAVPIRASEEARGALRLAFTLAPALTLGSAALYVWIGLGMGTWALALAALGLVVTWLFWRMVGSMCVDASFDGNRVCQNKGSASACVAWSEVAALRFDSYSACYKLVAASSSSSTTQTIKVFAFARGILDFEAKARELLGDATVAAAFAKTAEARRRLPGFSSMRETEMGSI